MISRNDYFGSEATQALHDYNLAFGVGKFLPYRANFETWILEAKHQMGLAHLKTDHFLANAVLAYNAKRWRAHMSNTQLKRWEP